MNYSKLMLAGVKNVRERNKRKKKKAGQRVDRDEGNRTQRVTSPTRSTFRGAFPRWITNNGVVSIYPRPPTLSRLSFECQSYCESRCCLSDRFTTKPRWCLNDHRNRTLKAVPLLSLYGAKPANRFDGPFLGFCCGCWRMNLCFE